MDCELYSQIETSLPREREAEAGSHTLLCSCCPAQVNAACWGQGFTPGENGLGQEQLALSCHGEGFLIQTLQNQGFYCVGVGRELLFKIILLC